MKKETYQHLVTVVDRTPYGARLIYGMDKLIVMATALAYILLLVYLFTIQDFDLLIPSILVPAVGFAGVSIFRRIYNASRPYEELDITPLIPKETKGRSFPSRHVFSIFIIGMTYLQVSRELALGIFALGLLLAALRVLAGVHYLRDVAAAMVMAFIIGWIGFL
jgi:membrane-associated phospholipid phosphatase